MTIDDGDDECVQVWLVERTYSDDEQNIIILTYARQRAPRGGVDRLSKLSKAPV
jgi:hypothetical protein